MCGKQPGEGVAPQEGIPAMPPMWITLDHPSFQEGNVIQPGHYDLCSEKCLQDLVSGKPPLGEKDVTVTSEISRVTEQPAPTE